MERHCIKISVKYFSVYNKLLERVEILNLIPAKIDDRPTHHLL